MAECHHYRGRVFDLKIAVVTLFPELLESFAANGIPRIAVEQGALSLFAVNPRDFTDDPHRTVDDRPYGGGPGMVMRAEPLSKAIRAARQLVLGQASGNDAANSARVTTVYMSPQGALFSQSLARQLAGRVDAGSQALASDDQLLSVTGLVLIAGRYEGVDERLIEQEVDHEWSIGDFVLSGGEIAAFAVIDCVARLLPGVLGNIESADNDSFGTDGLLDFPHYTRPAEFEAVAVPSVLKGGDHAAIALWRRQQSLLRTATRRPDLLRLARDKAVLTEKDVVFLRSAGIELD